MSRTHRNRLLAVAATLLALVAVAACGDDAADDGTTAATATAPAQAVTVWFVDASGRLVAERREAPAGAEPLEAAMAALAEGPRGADLLPALPEGTRVLGTRVEDGVAVVDLSAELERGYPSGGSAAELAIVAPLVRTAAEASGADRVRVLVEGRAPAPVGAQIDLGEPLAPGDVPTGG